MPTDQLTVSVNPGAREGQRVYKLSGPLTISTLFDFQTAVRAEKSPTVMLDLSDVSYIDSAGLGAVVNAHISCANSGRQFAIVGMSERVRPSSSSPEWSKRFPSSPASTKRRRDSPSLVRPEFETGNSKIETSKTKAKSVPNLPGGIPSSDFRVSCVAFFTNVQPLGPQPPQILPWCFSRPSPECGLVPRP